VFELGTSISKQQLLNKFEELPNGLEMNALNEWHYIMIEIQNLRQMNKTLIIHFDMPWHHIEGSVRVARKTKQDVMTWIVGLQN